MMDEMVNPRKRWKKRKQEKYHPLATKKFKRRCKADAERIAELSVMFDSHPYMFKGYSELPEWARDYCWSLIRNSGG